MKVSCIYTILFCAVFAISWNAYSCASAVSDADLQSHINEVLADLYVDSVISFTVPDDDSAIYCSRQVFLPISRFASSNVAEELLRAAVAKHKCTGPNDTGITIRTYNNHLFWSSECVLGSEVEIGE